MKIEKVTKVPFTPICITLETKEEAYALRDLIGNSTMEKLMKASDITLEQSDIVHGLWNELDELLDE